MARCKRCDQDGTESIQIEDTAEVAGHEFTAWLPAEKCHACNAVTVEGHHMKRYELCIAAALAKSGERSAEAFSFMRKRLGVSAAELGELLDVRADLVEVWESGHAAVDPRALAVLASLLLSKSDGRSTILDSLAVLREPRKLARRVRITLENALSGAAKALQFGSSAHSAPATA